ncbi:MAG TPA: hypothetical protein VKI65_01805, partial [Gemmataceae bacterium]|nr:hypothetical protein [Gemmataceae bacterium]
MRALGSWRQRLLTASAALLLITCVGTSTGQERATFKQGGGVDAITLSSDGKWLASCGLEATYLWNVGSGEMVRKLKAPPAKTIHALAFSPNGKTLAAGGNDYAVSIWDVVSGELQKKLEFGNGVRCLLYSRDGKRLYAGGSKDRVHSWDTTTWQEGPAFNYKYTVHAIALTPDDK